MIDTYNKTNFGKFYFDSTLLNESEARSISISIEINAFINQLVKEENMSPYIAIVKCLFGCHST